MRLIASLVLPSIAERPWAVVIAIIAALMLLATIFYPFGYDQAVFSTAGEMILRGAVPYRDFLDTKPPLIFYIYALALGIFGRHEWSIHAFDIIYQLLAAYYFFRILRRKCSADISLVAVSITLILYAGSGFWMTAQAESFALLPSLLLVDVTMRMVEMPSRAIYYGLLAGAAAIALLLLKFTLVFGAIATIVFLFFYARTEAGTKWRYAAGFIVSSILLLAGSAFAMWRVGALDRFLQSLTWLASYAAISPAQHSLLEEIFLIFPERVIYSMSISLLVLAAWGIVRWIRKTERAPLLTLLLMTFLFQLFGVLIERKIEFPYQYTRAVWAIAPFMAMGLSELIRSLVKFGKVGRNIGIILWVVCVPCVLLLSPLPRIFTQSIPWTRIALDHEDASAEVQRRIPDYYAEEEQQVAHYLSKKMAPSDQLFFWGNDVAVYFCSNKLPKTICLTATPFRTAFTPPEWKSTLLHQLATVPPKYFVVEFGDARPAITGSSLDSYQALLQWNGLESFLVNRYVSDTTIGHFHILHLTDLSHSSQ
ncbi:MAG TPA: glycosyltransferase family 39 protein [Candidatus Kapabacteria bacterium]|nr:glycosyltransferase family 39 protein [Candidatus Kapabacteria bacterium]